MENNHQVGVIGLGRMGLSISRRLRDKGYQVVGFDVAETNRASLEQASMTAASSLNELCSLLKKPRVILLLVPSGKAVSDSINSLSNLLDRGDIVVDCGNSYYKDSISRSAILNKHGIHFMDVGMSGGIGVSKNGACLTIGGEEEQFKRLEYLFRDISVDNGFMFAGPTGWGHLVKTIHNGIEYGFLQAIGEGLGVINEIAGRETVDIDLAKLCSTWSNGSIIESRLMKDAVNAFDLLNKDSSIKGSIGGGETGTWAKEIADDYNVKVPALKAALKFREESEQNPSFTGKIIAAIRNVFGGHQMSR